MERVAPAPPIERKLRAYKVHELLTSICRGSTMGTRPASLGPAAFSIKQKAAN